jgi:hypothetical protein
MLKIKPGLVITNFPTKMLKRLENPSKFCKIFEAPAVRAAKQPLASGARLTAQQAPESNVLDRWETGNLYYYQGK